MGSFPLIRHSERVDFKRCQKKWYWRWRKGLVLKAQTFGALELGTWVHEALARWYSGEQRELWEIFDEIAAIAISQAVAVNAPEHLIVKADELRMLGTVMMKAYQAKYGDDTNVNVLAAEIPLEFEIADPDLTGKIIAVHKLKPDLVYADEHGDVWLMEHKTAAQIRLEHLVIDDQARPYVAMAELALRKVGVLKKGQRFRGVMYNFIRKALPDERPTDAQGRYLNKNGTISKKQPSPVFVRHPITLTRDGKRIALFRLQREAIIITGVTHYIRTKQFPPNELSKTPHSSCPKLCPYFTMCVVEEQGGDIREMQRTMYVRRDPYLYDEETTDIPPSFELS